MDFGFREDGEDFDTVFYNVIEHPHVIYPQSVLGPVQSAEALDPALAQLRRLVLELLRHGGLDSRPVPCRQLHELLVGRRGKKHPVPHSGQSLATSAALREAR